MTLLYWLWLLGVAALAVHAVRRDIRLRRTLHALRVERSLDAFRQRQFDKYPRRN